MPWKESSVVGERIRFVIRLKGGEIMAALCREFQISRKTGYKITSVMRNLDWRGSRIVPGAPPLCQSTARADRSGHRSGQARETALGRPQDPGAPPSTTAE